MKDTLEPGGITVLVMILKMNLVIKFNSFDFELCRALELYAPVMDSTEDCCGASVG